MPALTAAAATGTYSANVGAGGRPRDGFVVIERLKPDAGERDGDYYYYYYDDSRPVMLVTC